MGPKWNFVLSIFFFMNVLSVQAKGPLLTTEVDLTGTYSWELLLDVDNSQNDEPIQRIVTFPTSFAASYKKLLQSIREDGFTGSSGFDIEGKFEVVSFGIATGVEGELRNILDDMLKLKQEVETETMKTEVYIVGPMSKLKIYRLVFNGLGVEYLTDTTSSSPYAMYNVQIKVQLRQVHFLSGIDVIFTNDSISRPEDIIQEVDGKNPDINAGFGGKYVWLVPQWTSRSVEGVTSVQVIIQTEENKEYQDLAKGAGGQYRYLKLSKNPISVNRITEIALWRTDKDNVKPEGAGWDASTTDINQDRKKDYLYLCWKTTSV